MVGRPRGRAGSWRACEPPAPDADAQRRPPGAHRARQEQEESRDGPGQVRGLASTGAAAPPTPSRQAARHGRAPSACRSRWRRARATRRSGSKGLPLWPGEITFWAKSSPTMGLGTDLLALVGGAPPRRSRSGSRVGTRPGTGIARGSSEQQRMPVGRQVVARPALGPGRRASGSLRGAPV